MSADGGRKLGDGLEGPVRGAGSCAKVGMATWGIARLGLRKRVKTARVAGIFMAFGRRSSRSMGVYAEGRGLR